MKVWQSAGEKVNLNLVKNRLQLMMELFQKNIMNWKKWVKSEKINTNK